jgi:cytoskeletal protein RodZ
MKTQLVQLESHDDLISIRDKMSWAKTPRILLAWPRTEHVDVRPLDLELLRRHAVSLGAELGLVTRDGEIRAAARRMHLPIFKSTAEAQRKPWPARKAASPRRRKARFNLRAIRAALPATELFDAARRPGGRLAVFATGVLAVLVVVMVFIPSAEIHMTRPTQEQRVKISVSAETAATKISLSGVIPAREIVFDVDESDSVLSSGQVMAPDQAAEGRVSFTNLTAARVEIPAGAVVLTRSDPPVRFSTQSVVEVPAGNGSNAEAYVRALAPGSNGNVPAGTILAFEGPLGLSLSVTNPVRMTGGTDVSMAAPTDADRQALRRRLLAKLTADAQSRLPAQVQSADVLFQSTFALSRIVAETYIPGPDQPGERLSLRLKAQFRAYYAAASDLNMLAAQVLDASLPSGYDALKDSLTVQPVSALFGSADGNTRWQVDATRMLQARIDPAQVIYLVEGKPVGRAAGLLQDTFGLEVAPQISIQPFFWPWLPALPFRISVAG